MRKFRVAVAMMVVLRSAFGVQVGGTTATLYVGRHFEIRDHDQPIKYVFNGATRVAAVTGSLSSNQRVQRLRLHPGWNLCSLAVSGTFPASGGETIVAAYQWNAGTGDYSQVTLGQAFGSGTILWLNARTNAAISVIGTYTDPTPQQVQAGKIYVPGAGLETWSPSLPNSASSWEYVAEAAQWSEHLTGDLAAISDLPPILSPGEALYLRAAAPLTLDIPDPALRVRYYHQDHLGSSSVITDSTGQILDESAYYPCGLARNAFEPRRIQEPYQFTQKERDRETGLHYFEARFLAGGLARFVRADPKYANAETLSIGDLSPQELNLYAYVRNNPLNYTDPTGLNWLGDLYDYAADNLWVPGRDSLSDLDVGRTAKVGGGIVLAGVTGGTGNIALGLVGAALGADQVTAGVLDRPSYLSQAGTALCGGNERCGVAADVTVPLLVGGVAATTPRVPTGPSIRPGSPPPPEKPWPDTMYEPPAPSPKTLPGWQPEGGAFNRAAYEAGRANAKAANAGEAWGQAINSSPKNAWFMATMDATRDYRYMLPLNEQPGAMRMILETAEALFPGM